VAAAGLPWTDSAACAPPVGACSGPLTGLDGPGAPDAAGAREGAAALDGVPEVALEPLEPHAAVITTVLTATAPPSLRQSRSVRKAGTSVAGQHWGRLS
jgi:hypothetical protein